LRSAFLVSFADETRTARSFAGKHRPNISALQELLAMASVRAVFAAVTGGQQR
jgi:hypothetical protein